MFVIHIITLFIFILVLACVFHKSFVEMLPVGISGLVAFIVRTQFWQTLGLDRWNCTTFTLRSRSLFLYEKKRTAEGAVKTVYRNSEGSIDYSRDYSATSGSDRSIREGGKLVG